MRPRIGAIAAVAVATLAGAGIASASVPDSNGTYTACVLKSIGTIRLIDPSRSQSCNTRFEYQITFNQKGPAGPRGVQGDPGPSGQTGAKGDKGDKGDPGPTGGLSGYEGEQQLITVPAGGHNFAALLQCPAGKNALGGRASVSPSGPDLVIRSQYPTYIFRLGETPEMLGIGWAALVDNNSETSGEQIVVRVLCANVEPAAIAGGLSVAGAQGMTSGDVWAQTR